MSLVTICGDTCPLSCISAEACLTGWPRAQGRRDGEVSYSPRLAANDSISTVQQFQNHVETKTVNSIRMTVKCDTPLPPVRRTLEIEHGGVMGGKNKYIEMFSSFRALQL